MADVNNTLFLIKNTFSCRFFNIVEKLPVRPCREKLGLELNKLKETDVLSIGPQGPRAAAAAAAGQGQSCTYPGNTLPLSDLFYRKQRTLNLYHVTKKIPNFHHQGRKIFSFQAKVENIKYPCSQSPINNHMCGLFQPYPRAHSRVISKTSIPISNFATDALETKPDIVYPKPMSFGNPLLVISTHGRRSLTLQIIQLSSLQCRQTQDGSIGIPSSLIPCPSCIGFLMLHPQEALRPLGTYVIFTNYRVKPQ